MKEKLFKKESSEIKVLIPPMGSCIASDKITVDGLLIGCMYREEPSFDTDSGWRFFSGTEDDDYVNDSDNLMIYDLNTIVNYDNSIMAYIHFDIGTELERQTDNTFRIIE